MQFHTLQSEEMAVKWWTMQIQQIKQFKGTYKNVSDL